MTRIATGLAAGSLLLISAPALAAGTPAGTRIDNIAEATFDGPGGQRATVKSNTVSVRVDEVLGVVVTSTDAGDVASRPSASGVPLAFRVTNAGNGPEAFGLSALGALGADDFDPTVTALALDTNRNGVYDPTADAPYVPAGNDPVLQPDDSIVVFVLSTMPDVLADGARGLGRLTATARTGSGEPGTAFAGRGENGGDAVVGTTRAEAFAQGRYAVGATSVALAKEAEVLDPFGGRRALPGSIVTYKLRASISGSGAVSNLVVSDPIPAGSVFQPGSITLNGAAQTDADDADAGRLDGTTVRVALGSPAAGNTHLVTFKVRIN